MVFGQEMQRANRLKIAVVCSSNQNRSMEAHNFLSKKNFNVKSYGSGTHVKLPGAFPDKPNIYSFDTTYDTMYKDLSKKDPVLYTQNGILNMLDRNRRIKPHPERFQDATEEFDVVITVEERVYDQVVEDMGSRYPSSYTPVHIINMDVQDNHEEATIGAFVICDICEKLEQLEDLEDDIDEVLQKIEKKTQRHLLHTVAFY